MGIKVDAGGSCGDPAFLEDGACSLSLNRMSFMTEKLTDNLGNGISFSEGCFPEFLYGLPGLLVFRIEGDGEAIEFLHSTMIEQRHHIGQGLFSCYRVYD